MAIIQSYTIWVRDQHNKRPLFMFHRNRAKQQEIDNNSSNLPECKWWLTLWLIDICRNY